MHPKWQKYTNQVSKQHYLMQGKGNREIGLRACLLAVSFLLFTYSIHSYIAPLPRAIFPDRRIFLIWAYLKNYALNQKIDPRTDLGSTHNPLLGALGYQSYYSNLP